MIYDNEDPMPWGKYKGLKIKFLKKNYLEWIKNNVESDDALVECAIDELKRRDEENDHVWDK